LRNPTGENMEAAISLSYGEDTWGRYFDIISQTTYPILAADENYLIKHRKKPLSIQIQRFNNVDHTVKVKIIEVLTDWVSGSIGNDILEDFDDDLDTQLKMIDEVKPLIDQLKSMFKNKLNVKERQDIIKQLIRSIYADTSLLYESIRDDLLKAKKDELKFVILSKQLIFEVVKLIGESKDKLEGQSEITKDISKKLNLSLYLLLRLEAVRLGKLEPEDLHDDITLASQYSKPVIQEDLVGTIYDVLGYVEI